MQRMACSMDESIPAIKPPGESVTRTSRRRAAPSCGRENNGQQRKKQKMDTQQTATLFQVLGGGSGQAVPPPTAQPLGPTDTTQRFWQLLDTLDRDNFSGEVVWGREARGSVLLGVNGTISKSLKIRAIR